MGESIGWIMRGVSDALVGKIDQILANQQTILNNQAELKELVMGAKEDLAQFALDVDAFTNACATAVTAIQAKLDALNALIASGASATEVKAAIDEVNAHLATVKTSLEGVAADGTPTVPEEPPVVEPPVEPL